jgi:hypothetical protein
VGEGQPSPGQRGRNLTIRLYDPDRDDAREAADLPELTVQMSADNQLGFESMREIPLKALPGEITKHYRQWANSFTLYRAFQHGAEYTTQVTMGDRHWWRWVSGKWVAVAETWRDTVERMKGR